MAVKIFEDEYRFKRYCLQVAECLGGFAAVVECLSAYVVCAIGYTAATCEEVSRLRDQLPDIRSAANKAAGDTPLESGEIQ